VPAKPSTYPRVTIAPGLKSRLDEAVADGYADARIEAAAQTSLEDDLFPVDCPYSFEEITERPIDLVLA